MTNLEKLNNIFAEVFSVEVSALGADFDNKSVENWDSVHQLSLTGGTGSFGNAVLNRFLRTDIGEVNVLFSASVNEI